MTTIKPVNPSKWIFEAIYNDANITVVQDMNHINNSLYKGNLVQVSILYNEIVFAFYVNVHGTKNYKTIQKYTTITGINYELVSNDADNLYKYMSNNGEYNTDKHIGQLYTTDPNYKDKMNSIIKMLNPTICEKIMNYIKNCFNIKRAT